MSTRGRKVKAIARSIELIAMVESDEGHGHAHYREQLGWTKGEFETAVRYALEDKQIRQEGRRRAARLWAVTKVIEQPVVDEDESAVVSSDKMALPDDYCSYCNIAQPEALKWGVDDDGNVAMGKIERYAVAFRQGFHLCRRCFSLRMPTEAEYHGDTADLEEWVGIQAMGEQKVLMVNGWKLLTIDGVRALCMVVEPLSDEGHQVGATEVYIRFTFPEDGTPRHSFARGYRFMHRMFSHPDQLVGKTIVVSREPNNGRVGWFWSWTPFPRIPLQVMRADRLQDDIFNTGRIELPPEDVSVPQHHIHSIVDDGVYTIIKVRKQLTQTSDDKYIALRDVVQAFLRGTATICDLEETLEELEGDDE